jgi:hypothetical protein
MLAGDCVGAPSTLFLFYPAKPQLMEILFISSSMVYTPNTTPTVLLVPAPKIGLPILNHPSTLELLNTC